jgi:methyl-accepting chemotaxis protein
MINKIKNMVSTIKETAVSLGGVTDEMKQAMEDLSHRSEAQASSLEETAASMEQISSTIRQNSDNSQQGSAIALSSQAAAVSGEKIVDEALEAMQLIESSSMRISDIMGVIDEIAFQTNLLALNAAVEAARAGEAGKGFAVVAEEVRNLAQRSAVASKEIKGLILTSNKQVSSGVRLVQEAGKSLKGILESTNNVASIVKEIAAASAEQSLGLEQINTAVSHMDEMTQQNASLVQTNMSSSLTLQEKAQILLNIVSQFQIGNEDASVITKPKVAEKMSLPSPKISTPKPVTEGARKSSDKIESPSSVTVQTVAKLSKEEDWAEF